MTTRPPVAATRAASVAVQRQKTNETQTVRVTNATGGTFTLTFNGQTTAPIAYNATAAQIQAALEALSNIAAGDILVTGGPINTGQPDGELPRRVRPDRTSPRSRPTAPALTGTGATLAATTAATSEGDLFSAPFVDARRTSQNTNDLRGKINRIKVAGRRLVHDPGREHVPGRHREDPSRDLRDGLPQPVPHPGRRERRRLHHRLLAGLQHAENFRGPAGTGRVEIVRKPSNYGWPLCYAPNLPYYRWNFNTSTPLDATPTPYECGNPDARPAERVALGASTAARRSSPASSTRRRSCSRTSGTPTATTPNPPLGTPCLAYYDGSSGTCPQLFPELFTGGVAPHGAAKYEFDPDNPNPKKFPPYYDESMFLGEFGQDTLREIRLDSQNKVFKINQLLNCGAVQANRTQPFECDNPNDMQFGADGAFYLLTYGDGFFAANADAGMYKWEYVKGQRAPERRAQHRPDRRPGAADGAVLLGGHDGRRPG